MFDVRTSNDIDKVRAVALMFSNRVVDLQNEVVRLRKEIMKMKGFPVDAKQAWLEGLELELDVHKRAIFGTKSEKTDLVESKAGDTPKNKADKKTDKTKRGHGPTKQPLLPIEELVHTLDEADLICPACNSNQLEPIPGQYEISQEITVVERSYKIIEHHLQKYRCSCNGHIETALGPKKLIPGGRYSLEFAAEVAVDKYLDHMPLERQSRRMKREGVEVTSQTLWDQIYALQKLLRPTADAILSAIQASKLAHADETTWRMMGQERSAPGKSAKHYLWAIANNNLVYFLAQNGRGNQAGLALLGDFSGVLMTDGYAVYQALAREGPQLTIDGGGGHVITLAHCWAHVRRKFFDLKNKYPFESTQILRLIRALYRLDEMAGDDIEARRKIRAVRSRKAVNNIRRWALLQGQRHLPGSALIKAIEYMNALWSGLTVFLDRPEVPLDNNHIERCIRGPVLGRKNHLGSMSNRGLETTALFYTLFESAKLAGVDPKKYLLKAAKAALDNPGTVTMPADCL